MLTVIGSGPEKKKIPFLSSKQILLLVEFGVSSGQLVPIRFKLGHSFFLHQTVIVV